MFEMNRVEEFFNFVEEEFMVDQEDVFIFFNIKIVNLMRENIFECIMLKFNRWFKLKVVIEFVKKLEEKEVMEVVIEVLSCLLF